MHEHPRAFGVLVAGLLAASCGGGEPALQGTCGKGPSLDGSNVQCLEVRATTAAALQSARDVTCGAAQWSSGGACPHDDRLGGCLSVYHQTSDGATIQEIYWYYPSATVQTEADAMNQCLAGAETFVPAGSGFPPF